MEANIVKEVQKVKRGVYQLKNIFLGLGLLQIYKLTSTVIEPMFTLRNTATTKMMKKVLLLLMTAVMVIIQ